MIFETEIREHSGLRVRVQARQCLDGSIPQRHIYYKTQLGEHDPPWVQEWIPSYTRKPDLAFRGMKPSNVRDELEEVLAALREIADGHNDARTRAKEALEIYDQHRI